MKLTQEEIDDVALRFIYNVPHADCFWRDENDLDLRFMYSFQKAFWWYIDVLKSNEKILQYNEKAFMTTFFDNFAPLNNIFEKDILKNKYAEFRRYNKAVPRAGVIVLSSDHQSILLVSNFNNGQFEVPRGKIGKDEELFECAIREFYEETSFDIRNYLDRFKFVETIDRKGTPCHFFLCVADLPVKEMKPQTVGEIKSIKYINLNNLNASKYYNCHHVIETLKKKNIIDDVAFSTKKSNKTDKKRQSTPKKSKRNTDVDQSDLQTPKLKPQIPTKEIQKPLSLSSKNNTITEDIEKKLFCQVKNPVKSTPSKKNKKKDKSSEETNNHTDKTLIKSPSNDNPFKKRGNRGKG
eukprot:TRINITY_DN1931_c0_g1_i1.p1 TRINITY_DN1931_c0_g1~~TRINITY_DN1931_c0_g1_i1.p1  ORF type:complete len:352 (-),score=94.66 TRINITY_DN1931_c0_g1_i1:130-1185(-)